MTVTICQILSQQKRRKCQPFIINTTKELFFFLIYIKVKSLRMQIKILLQTICKVNSLFLYQIHKIPNKSSEEFQLTNNVTQQFKIHQFTGIRGHGLVTICVQEVVNLWFLYISAFPTAIHKMINNSRFHINDP